MLKRPPIVPKTKTQIIVIAAILAIHLIADLGLWSYPLRLNPDGYANQHFIVIGLAFTCSQAGLLAIWASMANWKSYVRFPLGIFGITGIWFVTTRVLDLTVRNAGESAKFAFLFVVQSLVILLIYVLSQFVLRRIDRGKNRVAAEQPPLQFSIGFLLIWTTVFALLLGLGKTLWLQLGWMPEVIHDQYFFFCGVMGAYNAFFSLFALVAALARKRLLLRAVLVLCVIELIAISEEFLLQFIFSDNGNVQWPDWMLMAGCQALFIFATLLPLRWCGLLDGGRKESDASIIPPADIANANSA